MVWKTSRNQLVTLKSTLQSRSTAKTGFKDPTMANCQQLSTSPTLTPAINRRPHRITMKIANGRSIDSQIRNTYSDIHFWGYPPPLLFMKHPTNVYTDVDLFFISFYFSVVVVSGVLRGLLHVEYSHDSLLVIGCCARLLNRYAETPVGGWGRRSRDPITALL